jgi:WD40 repeat protein
LQVYIPDKPYEIFSLTYCFETIYNMKQRTFVLLFFILTLSSYAQTLKLETVIQKGHSASVKAVAVSPDGKILATGSRDKSVKLWDQQSGMEIRSLIGHDHTVNGLAFSPDGKLLATSSADGTARVWDILTGKEIFTSPKNSKYITDVAFNPDGKSFAYAGYPDSASIYAIPSGKLIKRLEVNADQGSGYGISLKYSNDGKWLAIGEDNKTANVYRTSDWHLAYTFKPAEGWCGGCGTYVEFSRDNKSLFKIAHNDKLSQYDLQTGSLIKTFGEPVDYLRGITLTKDGQHVIAASDSMLYNYTIASKTVVAYKLYLSETVNDIALSLDEKEILVASDNMTAWALEAASGKVIRTYQGALQEQDKGGLNYNADNYWEYNIARYLRLKNELLLTKDDNNFITGKTGVNAIQWNISTGAPNKLYEGHTKAVISMDQSADGSILATADGAGEVFLWNTKTGALINRIKPHTEPIFDVSLSRDGKYVATGSWDASIEVYDVQTGEVSSDMYLKENSCYSISFTPNGLYLLCGRLDKSLELREPDSKKVVLSFIGHTDVVSSIAFGADPNKALTASWDGTARIWDVTTGMMLQKFKGARGMLHSAIYSTDSKKIITGGDDRIIRIWDIQSGQVLKTLNGHQSEITSLSLSKDGKMLVSYSTDGVVKFWNLESGLEFYEHVHISSREWMARTPQGYFSATEQARADIHFVKGMDVYAPDQFFEYYRPDLIQQIFLNRGSSPTGMQNVENSLQLSPPPLIKLACIPNADGLQATLNIKVMDEGGGLSEIRLAHNGKNMAVALDPKKVVEGKGNSYIYSVPVSLVRGTNQFSGIAVSKGKIESAASLVSVVSDKAPSAAVCHVFAIGIDTYKNPAYTLNYAREDAEAFAESVKRNGANLYQKVIVHGLYDAAATRQNVLDTLKSLEAHIALNDVFIFYYAGHGSMVDQNFYFIPTECTSMYQATANNALAAETIQAGFKNIKALKQIIIMDACQSGGSVEVLAMRGANEEKAFAQLSRGAGIHVMASAGSEQNAKEILELKHGLFTYVLLEALNGKADGAPKDGKITIYELKSYLDDQVPELNSKYSGKIQFPYTFSRGSDFPIVLE